MAVSRALSTPCQCVSSFRHSPSLSPLKSASSLHSVAKVHSSATLLDLKLKLNNYNIDSRNGLSARFRGRGLRIQAFPSPLLSVESSRWAYAVSALVLMLAKNARIYKSFLVPLVALGAPPTLMSWIRGEYGLWSTLVLFLVRLFYYIPGDLELPFLFMIFVIIAPLQVLNQRGTQISTVFAIAAAAYLCFQQYRVSGGMKGCLEEGNVIPTIALLFLLCVPLLFVFQGLLF
eukprot:TRINITY_DN33351_c0_g1_i1.p1 TRINITY_DN33351_c0_g1~~TRINITY_DN33351_c0_g1_i1.p1  ORF type:complete len:251 (-),score=17.95 TRINITY_DN33351_c0_g1_i1:351-1046(-)